MEGSSRPAGPEERPFRSFVHGGTSSLLSAVATFPIYKTVFRQQISGAPVQRAVAGLLGEGPLKLYRGVAPPLLMKTLNGTLLFGLQDAFERRLSRLAVPRAALPGLAGLGAGAVEAAVFCPLERVQNVLQDGRNDRRLPTLRSVLRRLGERRLAAGFYRALPPVAARNALGSALYFGLRGPAAEAARGCGASPPLASFLSGTLVSMATSLALYPLSVLVANMQAKVERDAPGTPACWRSLWASRQRSVFLLYRGGSLVVLRSCLTWGITTALYDRQQKAEA